MYNYFIKTLKKELKPALGCTEPIAIALATSKASKYIDGEIVKIDLELSGNILKNAMGVGIPGTGLIGIDLAAILGMIAGNSDKGLEVLADINDRDVKESVLLREKQIVKINVTSREEKLYIKATLYNKLGESATVEIVNIHDNIVKIETDKEIIFEKEIEGKIANQIKDEEFITTVKDIWDFALNVDINDVDFILEGVKLNKALSEDGLKNKYGLQVGLNIKKNIDNGFLSSDYKNYPLMMTTAAIDARMDGSKLAAMSNSGSGDQGITAFIPVYSMWQKLDLSEDKLIRALLLSNLIPIHIKKNLGRLSALCGATVAGVGASAGYVYLHEGTYEQMIKAMANQIGGITGIFCDGAKTSCSLKVANSVDAAYTSAILGLNDKGVSGYEGIIDDDIEKTILNMATLGSKGMEKVDKMILEIMVAKTK
ncbi:L-cysteine desulfidase family protein [Helicovermis profundi]|uniref:UPF0597 protein HLPR_14120 n=1 Tax=Helicovermis profundi TaxID=3065157 RepID=A0AAU9E3H3_9FIRM|nr:L-serine ammonia-lyase, iron-sulfur-dependent, subunit alpha [Clostridia bacterium S502]